MIDLSNVNKVLITKDGKTNEWTHDPRGFLYRCTKGDREGDEVFGEDIEIMIEEDSDSHEIIRNTPEKLQSINGFETVWFNAKDDHVELDRFAEIVERIFGESDFDHPHLKPAEFYRISDQKLVAKWVFPGAGYFYPTTNEEDEKARLERTRRKVLNELLHAIKAVEDLGERIVEVGSLYDLDGNLSDANSALSLAYHELYKAELP